MSSKPCDYCRQKDEEIARLQREIDHAKRHKEFVVNSMKNKINETYSTALEVSNRLLHEVRQREIEREREEQEEGF